MLITSFYLHIPSFIWVKGFFFLKKHLKASKQTTVEINKFTSIARERALKPFELVNVTMSVLFSVKVQVTCAVCWAQAQCYCQPMGVWPSRALPEMKTWPPSQLLRSSRVSLPPPGQQSRRSDLLWGYLMSNMPGFELQVVRKLIRTPSRGDQINLRGWSMR